MEALSMNTYDKHNKHALTLFLNQLRAISSYIDDPSIQEIMINAPDNIWIETKGEMRKIDVNIPNLQIDGALNALASANEKKRVELVMDARMPGYRIASAMQPVGINGSAICIRKHSSSSRTLNQYLDEGAFSPVKMEEEKSHHDGMPDLKEVAKGGEALLEFFDWMIKTRQNIAVCGSTGSGKTTFMNALLERVPEDNRVVTIEDTAELKVKVPNYVGWETHEGEDITMRRLIKLALRFRPDRIILGEVRGPEAYDLLDAMNTGHSGGICSLHADNPLFALYRLESMVRMNPNASNLPLTALRTQIANTFNIVVFCARRGGIRRPVEIAMVEGAKDNEYQLKTIFKVGD